MAKQLKLTLSKSLIGRNPAQRRIVQALGLRRIGQSVVREDNDATRGILHKIGFMLSIEEV